MNEEAKVSLRPAVRDDMAYLKKLYIGAFPANERAPFGTLRGRARRGKADFFCVTADGAPAGMAYVISGGELSYVFYLAIDPGLRGRGYGSETLRLIRERYRGRVFLAIEDPAEKGAPNTAERVRRHGFYEKCGFRDLPGRLTELRMTYAVMGTGGPVLPDEYRRLMDGYAGRITSRLLNMNIRL